jgi:amino acid adenylation domain-containing protein/non-ribosomal peptide synthase protein (TIGR01720 family)
LKEVRTTALEAYEFQDLPFEMLLDKLEVQRDLSHTPIFQVMFVLQNIPTGEISLPNLEISPYDTEASIAKFDMQFTLAEHSGGISGSVEYNTDLFNAETILQLIKSYQLILENISENPQWPIAGIPIITAEDKDKLLSLCNSKIINEKTEIPVFKIFEEQAVKSPNAIALTFENIDVSYYQLNVRANRLARFIQKLGVKNDELVGLCLDRSIDMVIGIIAIFKAGGAYVPLDPTYPKERLDYIINDSNPKVIITSNEYLSNFGSANKNIVSIDEDWKEIEQENNSDLNVQISNHNLAYIIYTSGSTGNPKGVMVTHGNLNRLFNSTQTWYKFNDKDVWTFFHSYAFDFSVWELWGALIYGGRIVIVPYLISRSPEQFFNLLQKEKVTVLNQTPSAFRQLIQEDSKRPKNDRLRLRYVIFGGDKLDLHTLSPWFDKYGEKNPLLINMYGITETTVHVTYRPINLSDLTEMPGSIIGEPIHDLRIYILDKNLEPAPIGVPGEIYVGGSGLARGYKNQPDLTATRFIPDLFSKNPGERLYRTGDQARFLQNGDIEYLNRIDNQVQIHGFRVELGEIENVIGLHPEIVENIVVFNNETDNKKLVAYYVLKTDSEISVEEFRKFLKNKLPDYMLPGAFVKMEKFPLTEHGKIDRKKLPKAEFLRPTLETQYVEPSSEEERILTEIWKRLLNIDQIGINDNFFDLGGDSILSIQMIALANQQGLHLTPRQVFQFPLIKDLAEISIKNQDSIIRDNIISGEAPLTPIQSWFFEKHKTNPNRFNTSMFLELSEEISVEDLKSVTSELIKYHSVLRTEFIFTNDSWRQNIIPEIDDLPVEFIDLSNYKKKDLKEQVAAEVENVQGSFDIQNCPLFKVIYFHFGNNINPQLLVVFHHLILDGVSWRILINDFFTLLRQLLSNAQLDLGNRTTSYMRWSEELSKLAEYKNIDQESEYWKNLLNYKDIDYPIDFPKGKNTYGSTKDITLSMNTDQTKYLLTHIPEKYGVSINDVLIFVLLEVISKWCNAKRIAIELEGHGREDLFDNVDLSRTIGWFTTIYPVVFELIEGSYSDNFKNVNATLQKVPNKGLDFGLLKYLSNKNEIRHLINKIPHAQFNFNYLGQFDQTISEMEFEFKMSNYSAGMEQYPDEIKSNLINVVAVINGGQLHIRWLYSKNLFKTASIKRLAKNYIKILKNIIEN